MVTFEDIKPEFVTKIQTLCSKRHLSLFDKIRKEKNELELKSLLTEAQFGLYFDTIVEDLKYNNKVGGSQLRPDFLLEMNSQKVLAEVCHLNPAQKDMDIHRAEDLVVEEFEKSNHYIPIIRNVHSITWQIDKLSGQNGIIAQKANKYGPFVEGQTIPIILCVYLEFLSGLKPSDLYHSLNGHPTQFIGDFEYKEFFPGTIYHKLKTGLYYNNEQMKKNISGVLLMSNCESFTYYHNFSNTNRLSARNTAFFLNFQHPYK